eukprot:ctg_2305.g544
MDMAGLSRLNAELAAVACPPGGDTVVTCTVEVYSCKATTSDKRVSHSLEQRMGAAAAAATDEWAARHTLPSASLSAHLRKVLIYLVLVLNATFPDYDFTGAATALPEAFETYTVAEVQARVDAALEEVYARWGRRGSAAVAATDARECGCESGRWRSAGQPPAGRSRLAPQAETQSGGGWRPDDDNDRTADSSWRQWQRFRRQDAVATTAIAGGAAAQQRPRHAGTPVGGVARGHQLASVRGVRVRRSL